MVAIFLKEVDTYVADPGRMLMEEMCELERKETEGNIRMIILTMIFPTQHPYTLIAVCARHLL